MPKSQLLSQKRECDLIWKDLANGKKTNHILINYIWKYDDYEDELYCYYLFLKKEFDNRGYKFTFSKNVFKLKNAYPMGCDFIPFGIYHDFKYLTQCYYNLEEKYMRGQKDFDNSTFIKLSNFYEKCYFKFVSEQKKVDFKAKCLINQGINVKELFFDEFKLEGE